MLYTQSQLISYANYVLRINGILSEATHADRSNWETENNIQPLQVGQEITINTVGGLAISAEINKITGN